MRTKIRPATANDAYLIYELITELAQYERQECAVKVTPADLMRQLVGEQPPFQCVIAEVDGRAAGFALYFYAYSTWEGTSTLYLEDLYVRPHFRGAGAGGALMSHLAQEARNKQCSRFEWSVLDWNEPAIEFYRRIGAAPLSGWTRYRLESAAIDRLAGAQLNLEHLATSAVLSRQATVS